MHIAEDLKEALEFFKHNHGETVMCVDDEGRRIPCSNFAQAIKVFEEEDD